MNRLFPLSAALALLASLATGCDEKDNLSNQAEIVLNPASDIYYPAAGGATRIDVTTAYPWSVTSDRTWCQVTSQSDYFIISASQNNDPNPRPQAVVTVTSGEAGNYTTATLRVNQYGTAQGNLTLFPDTPVSFTAAGGSIQVSVQTDLESWSVASDRQWCTVTQQAEGFTVSAGENRTPDALAPATVTVKAGTGSDEVLRTLPVTQTGISITIDPATVTLPHNGGSQAVSVDCPLPYEVSAPAWVTVKQTGQGITLSAEASPLTTPRKGEVTIECYGVTATVKVTQQ